MTIELDPQNLGKITINVTYENKHAAVTIAASNPKTLEMLSQNATAMANILEQKTGQQTTIFIPNNQQADWKQDMNPNDQHQSENAQQQQAKQQNNNNSNQSSQSFLQQMRLGLA
jgi:flagellar hook-length control protein FliK